MDGPRFDALAKALGTAAPRRRLLAGLLGAALAAPLGRAAADACKAEGKPCKKTSQCCSGLCSEGVCRSICDAPLGTGACTCLSRVGAAGFACTGFEIVQLCSAADPSCPAETVCVASPCLPSDVEGACVPRCPSPSGCACNRQPAVCTDPEFATCGAITAGALRAAGARSGLSVTP